MDVILISLPLGERETVDINITEIAAMRAHTVTSYSYVDYTEITLKSGATFDCRIKRTDVLRKIQEAQEYDLD